MHKTVSNFSQAFPAKYKAFPKKFKSVATWRPTRRLVFDSSTLSSMPNNPAKKSARVKKTKP